MKVIRSHTRFQNTRVLCAAFFLFFLSASFAYAQEEELEIIPPSEADNLIFEIIADTSYENLRYGKLEDGVYEVSFDVVNYWDKVQPGIKYSLALYQVTEAGDALLDHFVGDDTITLDPGESERVRLTYTIPPALPVGTYELRGWLATEKGLDLAHAIIGEVEQIAQSGIFIDPYECALIIDEERFGLEQGVDLAPEETLFLECGINYAEEAPWLDTVSAEVVTRERSGFSEPVDSTTVTEGVDRSDLFRIEIPVLEKPQSYLAEVQLFDSEGTLVSNTLRARYIVRGESATIQNVTTDKNRYAAGEEAVVTAFVSGMAAAFPEARDDAAIDFFINPQPFDVRITIIDGDGGACSEGKQETVNRLGASVSFTVPITRDCTDAQVVVEAVGEEGVVLDTATADLDQEEEEPTQLSTKGTPEDRTIMVAGLLVLLLVIAILIILQLTRKKTPPPMPLLFLFILGAAAFFLTPEKSHAASFSASYLCFELPSTGPGYCDLTGTYDIPNRNSLTTADDVTPTASMSVYVCNNITSEHRISIGGSQVYSRNYASVSGDAEWEYRNSGTRSRNMGTYPVGSHNISFRWEFYHDWHDWGWNDQTEVETRSMSFTVQPADGECGIADGGSYVNEPSDANKCSAGTLANETFDNGTLSSSGSWNWQCLGGPGGEDASCSAEKPPPEPEVVITIENTAGGSCSNETVTLTPGSYSVVVPEGCGEFTAEIWGAGGGGGGDNGNNTAGNGQNGGDSSIAGFATAYGGTGGSQTTANMPGGSATGGDINTTGEQGYGRTNCSSPGRGGNGANSPDSYGLPAGGQSQPGGDARGTGGGGGGEWHTNTSCAAGGGAGGGYAGITSPRSVTPGDTLSVTVGAGGAGGSGNIGGGEGGDGYIEIHFGGSAASGPVTQSENGEPYQITWESKHAMSCEIFKRVADGDEAYTNDDWSAWESIFTQTIGDRAYDPNEALNYAQTETINFDIENPRDGYNYYHQWRAVCTNTGGDGESNTPIHQIYPDPIGNVTISQTSYSVDAYGNSLPNDESGDQQDFDISWTSENASYCEIEQRSRDVYLLPDPNDELESFGTFTQIWNTGDNSMPGFNATRTTQGDAVGTDTEEEWQITCINERPSAVGGNTMSDGPINHYVWARPEITFQICDLGEGPDGASCVYSGGTKDILINDETEIHWSNDPNLSNDICAAVTGNGFSTGGATVGEDNSIPQPDPNYPETYTISCTGNGGYATESLVLSSHPIPQLIAEDLSVEIGDDVTIDWDINSTDPAVLGSCTIFDSGGTVYQEAGTIATETGTFDAAIYTTETYTLSCENGTHSITIFAVPDIFEN